MNEQPSTKQATVTRKTVLFCQECDYQAPPTGRWIVHEKIDCAVYQCPDCGATVTVRSRFER